LIPPTIATTPPINQHTFDILYSMASDEYKVELFLYDLSQGMVKGMSKAFIGKQIGSFSEFQVSKTEHINVARHFSIVPHILHALHRTTVPPSRRAIQSAPPTLKIEPSHWPFRFLHYFRRAATGLDRRYLAHGRRRALPLASVRARMVLWRRHSGRSRRHHNGRQTIGNHRHGHDEHSSRSV
jgi:hypothetical protein